MTQSSNSAGIEPLVLRSEHYRAIAKALRLLVGRGRRFSYKEAQRGAGVPERMLMAFRHDPDHEEWREARPEQFASMVKFLGADFTSTYLEAITAGQAAYDLPDEDSPPPGQLAADAADDSAALTRKAQEGRYIPHDPDLGLIGTRMMSRGAGLVKLMRAA